MSAVAQEEVVSYIVDGYLVNADGEVIGLVDQKPEFKIDSREAAEWVLEKLNLAEAEAEAAMQTGAVLAARKVIKNAENMAKDAKGRANWLRLRFTEDLVEWAKTALAATGSKSKSIKTQFGLVGTETKPGGLRVADPQKALALASQLEWEPTIKVTREFQISKLTKEQEGIILSVLESEGSSLDDAALRATFAAAFTIEKPTEKPKVDTGFGK